MVSKNNKKLWLEIEGSGREVSHLLGNFETRLRDFLYPRIPGFIQTYHLTWSSLFFSLGVLFFCWQAKDNKLNFIFVNLMIIGHHLADLMDGEVGRRRKTGLIKWGFYVDHFLDFIFSAAIIVGYYLAFPQFAEAFYVILAFFAVFFVDSLLRCIAFGSYSTSGYFGFGPSEVAASMVVFNFLISFFEWFPAGFFFYTTAVIFVLTGLIGFYNAQHSLWRIDLSAKNQERLNGQ